MNMSIKSPDNCVELKVPLERLKETLFRPMGVDGVYGRTGLYEGIVERLAALISRMREPGTEVLRFPPVMSRRDLERHGYLKSFPNLLGCVCTLHGSEADIRAAADRHADGGNWTDALAVDDLVLSPAACYPVYPLVAARGPVPRGGLLFDVACDCFRHEPSPHLDRLQSFRMREYVCIGAPSEVAAFRSRWIERARSLADNLCLPCGIEEASDPFFGRVGQMMAVSQLQQSLKFELVVPLRGSGQPTACMSFNCHREHFGEAWDIRDEDGALVHTACTAFGMDRLAVALFHIHGTTPASWPHSVRAALDL